MLKTGKEYATAIFSLACEGKKEKEYFSALTTVDEVFSGTEGLYDLLHSPAIAKGERVDIIAAAFEGRIPEQVLYLLSLMCENEDIYLLPSAIREFRAMYYEKSNIKEARIISAAPLTDGERDRLVKALERRLCCGIAAEFHIDPAIIGGVRVETDTLSFDGSIEGRIKSLKKEVLSGEG